MNTRLVQAKGSWYDGNIFIGMPSLEVGGKCSGLRFVLRLSIWVRKNTLFFCCVKKYHLWSNSKAKHDPNLVLGKKVESKIDKWCLSCELQKH